MRGKGKNDIENMIAQSNYNKQDQDLIDQVYGHNPLDFIKNQITKRAQPDVNYPLEVTDADIALYR